MTDPTLKRVDESWKEQVTREQQQARATASAEAPDAAAPQASRPAPASDQRFEALISSLAMEGFVHLGDVPHPATNTRNVNLQQAKYVIDLLGALEQKTQGNLSTTEGQQLGDYLYQLRMRYVEKTQPPIPPPPGSKEARA